jgi:hypothetical protein
VALTGLILTFNSSDLQASILGQFHIEAIHPDEFICRLFDEQPDSVLEAVRLQRAGLRNPPKSATDYLATLEQCQLPETAGRLRAFTADF